MPKWVNVTKERFNEILSTITKAKNVELKTNVDGREITLDNAESLLKREKQIEVSLKKSTAILLMMWMQYYRSQCSQEIKKKMVGLRIKKSLEFKDKELDEKPDTADMPELEGSDESAAQKEQSAKGLKILTPDQMLRGLPISLAQLKAGNNSVKRKNEIRQLLYSSYRSKK